MIMTAVKICGIRTRKALGAAQQAGADWAGFVLVPESPRAVTPEQAEMLLASTGQVQGVALVADADDLLIDAVRLSGFPVIQLHGRETPDRVADIKARTGAEIWKAIGVAEVSDLGVAQDYEAADRLLIDARPPEGADRTGGHGQAFDWSILQDWQAPRPWLLAGGLTPASVASAIHATGAGAVDVSSGVESRPGVKDTGLIGEFIRNARGL